MADIFDVVDIAFDALDGCAEGFTFYKGRSKDGEKSDHVVVSSPLLNGQDYVNKGYVNVNIYVSLLHNGTENRRLMTEAFRSVKSAIRSLTHPFGMYWKSRIVWSEPMEGAKEGFDCMNIRVEIITELD